MLNKLLSQLNAVNKYFQFFHWKAKGNLSYQDHLLAERIYDEINELIDGVAEKAIGLFGNKEIDMVDDAQSILKILTELKSLLANHSLHEVGLKSIKDTISFIEELKKDLEKENKLTDGLDNLLQGICDKLESHEYLLTQRTADIKKASLKYAAIPGSKQWWLSPEGKLYFAPRGHSFFCLEHPELFGGEDNDILYMDWALDNGWSRIAYMSNGLNFEFSPPLTNTKLHNIQKVLNELPKSDLVMIDTFQDFIQVPYSIFASAVDIKDLDKKPNSIGLYTRLTKSSVIEQLVKLAYHLDLRGLYSEADKIDAMIETLAKQVGLISEAKSKSYKEYKGKTQKKPIKDRPRPPKKWFEEMVENSLAGVKKRFPKISEKEARRRTEAMVGDIWHNQLSDKKIESLLKKYK